MRMLHVGAGLLLFLAVSLQPAFAGCSFERSPDRRTVTVRCDGGGSGVIDGDVSTSNYFGFVTFPGGRQVTFNIDWPTVS